MEPLLVSCPQCRKDFLAPTGRRHCSPACRSAAHRERQTDRIGEQWPIEETTFREWEFVTPCYYCGLAADTQDHVRPQSLGDSASFFEKRALPPDIIVPSCRECNSALGAKLFRTLKQRKDWIKKWLRRRYRRLLNLPHWTDAELGRLGGTLQIHIRSQQEAAATSWARLRW